VGNLGASEARCINVKMVSESISVSCTTGQVSEVTHFGVYQKDSEADQRGLCTAEGVNVNTGFDCSALSKKDSSLYTDKLQACIGQTSCMITGLHDDISLGPHGGDCNVKEQDSLFIQYSCKVTEEELKEKRQQALLAGCVEVFAALTLLSVVAYRQGSIAIEKKEFDLQTVTASDYALEVKLSREQIDQMKNDIY